MSPVGFERTILVSERQKTHALDRAATGIPAVFTPRKYFWYSFLLEAESTAGP
jgi:hypothetical protein